jgi:dihydrofolate reductase
MKAAAIIAKSVSCRQTFVTRGIAMKKVIYAINTTLDGVCDHTKVSPDDGLYDHYIRLMREADVLVYGRKTYELMIPYWPDIAKSQSASVKENEFALAFNAVGKIVVFSRSLPEAEGKKTRIVRTNPRDEILKLKQEPGRNILLGGVDLASQIMALGLVDEYQILVQPTLAGAGRRLLEGVSLPESLKLKLVESKVFESGNVALRYLKR